MNKKVIAVLFGGRSPEHEISIITGIQVTNAINRNKYDVLPVYVTKEGRWILGDKSFLKPETFNNLDAVISNKKSLIMSSDPSRNGLIIEPKRLSISNTFSIENVDMVFPAFHGRYGEDGAMQGLLELANLPYVGCDVQASAIGMDKVASKKIAKSIGIPVLKDFWLNSANWKKNKKDLLSEIKNTLGFPVFIKPSRLGSSIGISVARNSGQLEESLNVAFFYDTRVMVEMALEKAKEVNISILGNDPFEVSVCEMPVSSGSILSFEDKYISKKGASKGMASAKRIIPAPIKASTKVRIEEYSRKFFAEIGGQGIARIDFVVNGNEKEIYFNEINTMPGSVAFYLWKENGISFAELVDKLIDLGFKRFEERNKLITTFKSNVLSGFKGTKGIKT